MAKKAAEGGVTKMDAIRQALKEGKEKPAEGVAFVKEKFGLTIDKNVFGSYKSMIKKKEMSGSTTSKKPVAVASKNGAVDPVAAAQAVKQLVDQFGAATVEGLVKLFK